MTASSPRGSSGFPPNGPPPPQAPEGWSVKFSTEHNQWFYINNATEKPSWTLPSTDGPLPNSPPPYGYPPQSNPQENIYAADSESSTTRGFGLPHIFSHHSTPNTPPPVVNNASRPTGPFSTPSDAPLYIHAACYCDQDITSKVRAMVTAQQTLSIRCDALTYHFGDPWPGHVKQFSLLYSYGTQPWQLVATKEGRDTITLHPIHPVDTLRTAFVQAPSPQGKIVAIVWGVKNALDEDHQGATTTGRSKGMKMMEVEREGRLEASNTWMGFDGAYGMVKMAVVYYRNGDGSVGVLTAREGETLRLPWNAFAGAF